MLLTHAPAYPALRGFATCAAVSNVPPVQASPRPLRGARVLVVDDEPGISDLLRDLLEAAGCTVCTAGSVQEALRHLSNQSFDLVVSDLRMPDTDGTGLWRALRSQYPKLTSRLLFITGDTLSPAVDAFLSASGCPSLEKPFSRADLVRLLAGLLPH